MCWDHREWDPALPSRSMWSGEKHSDRSGKAWGIRGCFSTQGVSSELRQGKSSSLAPDPELLFGGKVDTNHLSRFLSYKQWLGSKDPTGIPDNFIVTTVFLKHKSDHVSKVLLKVPNHCRGPQGPGRAHLAHLSDCISPTLTKPGPHSPHFVPQTCQVLLPSQGLLPSDPHPCSSPPKSSGLNVRASSFPWPLCLKQTPFIAFLALWQSSSFCLLTLGFVCFP